MARLRDLFRLGRGLARLLNGVQCGRRVVPLEVTGGERDRDIADDGCRVRGGSVKGGPWPVDVAEGSAAHQVERRREPPVHRGRILLRLADPPAEQFDVGAFPTSEAGRL